MTVMHSTPKSQESLPLGRVPLPDSDFDLARQAVGQIRGTDLRRRIMSALVLARGVGASSAELRYVTGEDVSSKERAGTWVEIRYPGRERRVPVLERFADELRQLSLQARGGPLVGAKDHDSPLPGSLPGALMSRLQGELARTHPHACVTIERLRRAWLVEQLGGELPFREYLAFTGETSLRTALDLASFCLPPDLGDARIARLMGAQSAMDMIDLALWDLDAS